MKKQNKRVLHLLPSNSFSGAENVACTIIENNDKYDMFYCCPKGPIEDVLKEKNIKYIPIKRVTPWSLNKILREYDIDIIHAHDFIASFVAGVSNFKGKIISHLHNNPPFIKKWNVYTMAYSLVSRRFYKVAVVSNSVYDEAVFKKAIKDKCQVVSNVVNKERVIEMSKEYYDVKYDIAFIGRITEQKDPLKFIEIINNLKKKNIDINAVMIGSGDLENKCHDLILKYNLNENIDMLGFQSNPFKFLKNVKIVLMPSKFEGFGLTAIESMCLGKPVLNSGKGGLYTIFDDFNEFICDDVDSYTELSFKLLTDDDLLSIYKHNCEKIIEKYVRIDLWMNSIYSLYE